VVTAGQTLLGRYLLEEVIGVGGMGTVIRGRDSVLDRTVAVKVLKDELASDVSTLERFQREARIVASLSHPGIAHVFDFAEQDGNSFIIMELLDGEDLHQLLQREKVLEPVSAAQIAAQVADALQHAHERGAIHRDVKPGNIFMTRSGGVKVTDFGVAWAASQAPVTRAGDVVGTPHYLAPELVAGGKASPASDIYALGCVLYQMISGSPPYEADSNVAVAIAHRESPVPDLADASSFVPKGIAQAVRIAMSKEPSDRYSTASEFADALRSGVPTSSGPATVAMVAESPTAIIPAIAERAPEIARKVRSLRRPLIAVAVAVMLLLLLWAASAFLGRPSGPLQMPNLVGKTVDDAEGQAKGLGLEVERRVQPGAAPSGQVFGQEPAAGQTVSARSRVVLIVSDGGGAQVPSLIGLDVDEATAALAAQGLKPKIVEVPSEKDGEVVSQNPAAGTIVGRDFEVEVGVGVTVERRRGKGKGGND